MIRALFKLSRAAVLVSIAVVIVSFAQPIALAGIRGYRSTLAPIVARTGIECRFTTSCSRYAEVVIERDGVVRGGWLAIKRIARCGPWTAMGTRDDP